MGQHVHGLRVQCVGETTMKDYSGYVIAVLFVLFLGIVAAYDGMLRVALADVEYLRSRNADLAQIATDSTTALLAVEPCPPAPLPQTRKSEVVEKKVVVPTFERGVRFD